MSEHSNNGKLPNDFFLNFDFDSENPEAGKLLISEPFLFDPSFKRSVVLLVEHSNDGSVGFILNKPVDLVLEDALEEFPKFDAELYFGGPVNPHNLFFIHTLGEKLTNSQKIINGLYWGGDFDQLKLLIDTKQVSPEEIQFFAGYSGWGPQQLSDELDQKSWIVTPANADWIMQGQTKDFWKDTLTSLGKKFAIMANFPEDPSLN